MTNNGRLKVIPSVFSIVLKDRKVLLLRRANTGYADGWYDLPAGHLEDQEEFREGAARELAEETGLRAKPKDLNLVHVYQNYTNPDTPHFGYIFLASKWSGEPRIMETNKCDDMGWFALDNLPPKTLSYTKNAIGNIDSDRPGMTYVGPGAIG